MRGEGQWCICSENSCTFSLYGRRGGAPNKEEGLGIPREGLPMNAQDDSIQKSWDDTSPDTTTQWVVLR